MQYSQINKVVPPSQEPLTLDQIKSFLRIDHDIEDQLLRSLLASATLHIEKCMERSLLTQTWEVIYKCQNNKYMFLPMGPVQEIELLQFYTQNNEYLEIDSSNYSISLDKNYINFNTLFVADQLHIRYKAGFANTPEHIPEDIQIALLTYITTMYENRSGFTDIPKLSLAVCKKYKLPRI